MPAPRGVGPFRGLAPFEEADDGALFGRDDERRRIEALLAADGGSLLVTGEPGTGKTSLLRAVLLPRARTAGYLPFFVEVLDGWEELLRDELARYVGRKLDPGDDTAKVLGSVAEQRGVRLLLVLDQLEQLSWLPDPQDERLRRLLDELDHSKVRLVLSVERAHLHVLGQLKGLPGRIPDEQRILLGRLERQQVAGLIEQTILAGSGYMEAGLPDAIAEELCADGAAVPADFQRVCHAALLQHSLTHKTYQRAGGASVLGTLYVERLAAQVGGWRVRRVLAPIAEAENPRAMIAPGEAAAGAGLTEGATRAIYDRLCDAGLLRGIETPGKGKRYGLLHPYLRQSLRDFVAPLSRGRANARLALRRRVGSTALLRPHELVTIWRYLGRSLTDREQARVQRSMRVWLVAAAIVFALPFLVYFGIYLKLASTVYLATAPDAAGTQRVVLRRGDPSLAFAFNWSATAFGDVKLDTGLAAASLPEKLAERVRSEAVSGSLEGEEKGLPRWLRVLLKPMTEVRRGAFVMLAGQQAEGSTLLLSAGSKAGEREAAARMLGLLSSDSLAIRRALLACLEDSEAGVRRYAVAAAARLAAADALPILEKAVRDSDPQVRRAALAALDRQPMQKRLELLGARLLDKDDRVQGAALAQVQAAVDSQPLPVFDIVAATLASGDRRRLPPIRARLRRLRQRVLVKVPKRLAAHLLTQVKNDKELSRRRERVRLLVALADHLDAARVLPVVSELVKSPDVELRAAAIGLKARFGKAEEVFEELQQLSRSYRPRKTAVAMRRAAAVGLGLVRGEVKDRLKVLKRLLGDPARSVRAAAVASLLRSGGPGLREIVNRMRRGFVDVGEAALDVVCRDLTPNRRVATVVLSASWTVRGGRLREQALGCAQSLAAASFRLSMWLADQATVLKEPAMRRAAAPAVALALQKRGAGLARLARFYLRDRDPGVRQAVLEAIAARPSKKSSTFLFRYVEPLARAAEPGVRAAAAALLVPTAQKIDDALAPLIKLLRDDEASVRRAAVRATKALSATTLGSQRKALSEALAQVVSRGRGSDALAALTAAGRLGLRNTLERAAAHPEARVRAAAVERLSESGDAQTVAKVLEAARRDSAPALRLAALKAIGARSKQLGKKAVELLLRSIEGGAAAERWAAFEALGHVEGDAVEPAVALLRQQAQHRSEERRRLAMRALGRLSRSVTAAGQALFAGARDAAHDVRVEALGALGAFLGRTQKLGQLWDLLLSSQRDGVQRRIAIAALAAHGHGALADLQARVVKLPKDTRPALRIAANLALALARSRELPVKVLSELYGW